MTTTETTVVGPDATGPGRGGRMSRRRKRDAVLRLLRGEDMGLVSRALGVTAATLSGWPDAFLVADEAGLAIRATDEEALEAGGSKPGWARCCSSASCWRPRSRLWKVDALWPGGGRDHEPGDLAQ